MADIALYGGNILVPGDGGVCVSCCHAFLNLCNLNAGGLYNACGVGGEDDVEWRSTLPGGNALYRTASILYYATAAGVKRYTTGNVYIDTVYAAYNCQDVVADSAGNMYIAHQRQNNRTLSKLNSSGVFQWAHDLGPPIMGLIYGFCVALSFDEARVAYSGNRVVTVSLDSDGNFEWSSNIDATRPKAMDFDAFGNLYAIRAGGRVFKVDPAGNTVWFRDFGAISWQIVTDNVYVYVCGQSIINLAVGYLFALTVPTDPANPGQTIIVWNNITVGSCLCLDSSGSLFVSRLLGDLYDIDPSNGNANWNMTGQEVWGHGDAWNNRTYGIHAGTKPVPLPWACNTAHIVGDLVLHNAVVYECTQAHTSCGDIVWTIGAWTIGDRVFYPAPQSAINAYILENNNKGGGDTDPPGVDADWVSDQDEPGVGNHWTDYWQAAA